MISAIIPRANPDFENSIEKVDFWKIEFNSIKNYTEKEIGFNNNGELIVAMPMGNNYGYWTDNNLTLEEIKHLILVRFQVTNLTKIGMNLKRNIKINVFQHTNPILNKRARIYPLSQKLIIGSNFTLVPIIRFLYLHKN